MPALFPRLQRRQTHANHRGEVSLRLLEPVTDGPNFVRLDRRCGPHVAEYYCSLGDEGLSLGAFPSAALAEASVRFSLPRSVAVFATTVACLASVVASLARMVASLARTLVSLTTTVGDFWPLAASAARCEAISCAVSMSAAATASI